MLVLLDKITSDLKVNGFPAKENLFSYEGIIINREFTDFEFVKTNIENIQRTIKGRYVLLFKDGKNSPLYIMNDWISKMPVYYYNGSNYFIASNSFFEIIEKCKQLKILLTVSNEGLYFAIKKFGMCENFTQFNEIKYLCRYEGIKIDGSFVEITKNCPRKIKLENRNILDDLNYLFKNALTLQVDYNFEKKYQNVFTISAGMDSRMVLLTAKKMNYNTDFCINYSQYGSIDFSIPYSICKDFNIPLIYKDLSDGKCLLHLNDAFSRNEGQQFYCGSTGAFLFQENDLWLLNDRKAIIHSGLLGGELLGYEKTDDGEQYEMTGNIFLDSICKKLNSRKMPSREIFLLNNTRLCQNLIFQLKDCGFAFSPFMDEDFYEYALNIPKKYLKKRNLYYKWMKTTIPNTYITTYNNSKIGASRLRIFINKSINFVRKKITGKNKFDMNPFELWYNNNCEIRKFMDKNFVELLEITNSKLPISSLELDTIYKKSNVRTKASLITYLKVINLI